MKEGRKEGGKRERDVRGREERERVEGAEGGRFAFSEFECGVGKVAGSAKKVWEEGDETSEERSHPRLDGCRHFDPNYERAFLIEGASRSIPSLSQHSRHGRQLRFRFRKLASQQRTN